MKPYSLLLAVLMIIGFTASSFATTAPRAHAAQQLSQQATHAGFFDDMGDMLVGIGPSLWSGITQMANWLMGGVQMIASFFNDKISEAVAAFTKTDEPYQVAKLDSNDQLTAQIAAQNAAAESRLAPYRNQPDAAPSISINEQSKLGTITTVIADSPTIAQSAVHGAQ